MKYGRFDHGCANVEASRLHGEDLKAHARGQDQGRCLANFQEGGGSHSTAFSRFASEGVYSPSTFEMANWMPSIDNLLQSGNVQVLIPMHEKGDHNVPAPVLDYLLDNCRIPKESILVVNHLSGDLAVRRVFDRKVPMVDALEVIKCLDPAVCAMAGLPELRLGKGIAVLAGLLALRGISNFHGSDRPFQWVMMHDSELIRVNEYDGARYITYPLVCDGDNPHRMILECQSGRNNEAVHCARVAIEADAIFNPVPSIANYAREIGPRLMRLSWMLCGERILDANTLMNLPLSTGYVLETILNFGVEGLNIYDERTTGQVMNSGGRLDACSGEYAEQFMMNMIGRAIRAFVLMGIPPHRWEISDIVRLNVGFAQMPVVPAIAEFQGPVICRETPADRVLPSVETIWKNGWVDEERLKKHLPSY